MYVYIYIQKRTSSSNIPFSEHNSFNLLLINSSAPSKFPPDLLTSFWYILICVFNLITTGSKNIC